MEKSVFIQGRSSEAVDADCYPRIGLPGFHLDYYCLLPVANDGENVEFRHGRRNVCL